MLPAARERAAQLLVPALAPGSDGEALAALEALRRHLAAEGLDAHDLAHAVRSATAAGPGWRTLLAMARAQAWRLSQADRELVEDLRHAVGPSPEQVDRLRRIVAGLRAAPGSTATHGR